MGIICNLFPRISISYINEWISLYVLCVVALYAPNGHTVPSLWCSHCAHNWHTVSLLSLPRMPDQPGLECLLHHSRALVPSLQSFYKCVGVFAGKGVYHQWVWMWIVKGRRWRLRRLFGLGWDSNDIALLERELISSRHPICLRVKTSWKMRREGGDDTLSIQAAV